MASNARHGGKGPARRPVAGRGGGHGRGGQKQAHVRAVRYTPRHSSKAAGRAALAAAPGKTGARHAWPAAGAPAERRRRPRRRCDLLHSPIASCSN